MIIVDRHRDDDWISRFNTKTLIQRSKLELVSKFLMTARLGVFGSSCMMNLLIVSQASKLITAKCRSTIKITKVLSVYVYVDKRYC